jgi:hypothetical protein
MESSGLFIHIVTSVFRSLVVFPSSEVQNGVEKLFFASLRSYPECAKVHGSRVNGVQNPAEKVTSRHNLLF